MSPFYIIYSPFNIQPGYYSYGSLIKGYMHDYKLIDSRYIIYFKKIVKYHFYLWLLP